jgi:uncharacterized protein YidB (DUF937 family)
MGMLEDIIGSAVPRGNLAKPLAIAAVALLASGALRQGSAPAGSTTTTAINPPNDLNAGILGGLGGLLGRFQQNGLGDVVGSWIGSGQNQPIAPNQLGSALGPAVLTSLAQRTGLSEQDLLSHLSQILPSIVDKLTPDGRLPTPQEVAGLH